MGFKVDFKALAESIDIADVARHLKLTMVKDRAACPTCDSERAIQLFPETNSFRCHSASLSGDCISLYAHVLGYTGMYKAAKELQEQFSVSLPGHVGQVPETSRATPPQKSGAPLASASPSAPSLPPKKGVVGEFDPESYAAKLAYTDEVAALGIGQEDAARLGIGFASTGLHRGRIVFCVRNPDGTVAGFVGVNGADLKLPNKWIAPKVVQLRRA